MATIDDARCRLLVGQAVRLRDETSEAAELLRRGKVDEARELVTRMTFLSRAIWHELHLALEPPREIPIRGKSRRR
jgi:hypothetical protein